MKAQTMGEIMRPIIDATTREEALALLADYEKEEPEFARANVRHMLGYYSQDTSVRLSDWLGFTSTGWAASLGLEGLLK